MAFQNSPRSGTDIFLDARRDASRLVHTRYCASTACTRSVMLNSSSDTVIYTVGHPFGLDGHAGVLLEYADKKEQRAMREAAYLSVGVLKDDYSVLAHLFHTLFTPSPLLARTFLTRSPLSTAASQNYIALHIRLGKGVGETGARFRDINERCVHAKMVHTVKAIQKRHPFLNTVFIATDTPQTRRNFMQVAQSEGLASSVLAGDWDIKHSALLRPNKSDSADADHKLNQYLLSMLDMLLLAKANVLVAMKSRFADFAGFMSGKQPFIIVNVNGGHDACFNM